MGKITVGGGNRVKQRSRGVSMNGIKDKKLIIGKESVGRGSRRKAGAADR